MLKEAPGWQAHLASGYDGAMTAQCDRLLAEIVADTGRRKAIMADPRDLHRELFGGFAPADYPEYAGTYRGTPDTPLADVRMSAPSQIDPEVVYEFCPPREVPWRMKELGINIYSLLNEPDQDQGHQRTSSHRRSGHALIPRSNREARVAGRRLQGTRSTTARESTWTEAAAGDDMMVDRDGSMVVLLALALGVCLVFAADMKRQRDALRGACTKVARQRHALLRAQRVSANLGFDLRARKEPGRCAP